MQMYVNYYTGKLMNAGDTPPFGTALCTDKNDAVIAYTLPIDNNQIFALKYFTYLPAEEELRREEGCGWMAFGNWMIKTSPTIKLYCENQ